MLVVRVYVSWSKRLQWPSDRGCRQGAFPSSPLSTAPLQCYRHNVLAIVLSKICDPSEYDQHNAFASENSEPIPGVQCRQESERPQLGEINIAFTD